jgi:hypothetical protein
MLGDFKWVNMICLATQGGNWEGVALFLSYIENHNSRNFGSLLQNSLNESPLIVEVAEILKCGNSNGVPVK